MKKIKLKPATAPLVEERTTLDEEMAALESRRHTSPQQKALVVVDIDGSGSTKVSGALVLALKAGEGILLQAADDPVMRTSAEFAVVVYDHRVMPLREFGPLQEGEIWHVETDVSRIGGGTTKTAQAAMRAFSMLENRVEELSADGIPTRAKVVVVLTDGHANDSAADTQAAIAKRIELEKRKNFKMFGVAVGDGVDMAQLRELCGGEPLVLADQTCFATFWNWIYELSLTASMTSFSEEIELPNPIAGEGNPTGFAKHWLRF